MDIGDLSQRNKKLNESSRVIRERVKAARKMQEKRFKGTKLKFNSEMSPSDIEKYCVLGSRERAYLEEVFCRMELSARAYHKILRLSRTIADIEESEEITELHIMEAVSYRMTDGKYWQQKEQI